MTTSGCSKNRVAVDPSRIRSSPRGSVAASSSGDPSGTTVASRRWEDQVAGHRTRRASAVTSTPLAACRVARAIAGVVAPRNQSATCGPSGSPAQPSQAWAIASAKVSQSRSIRPRSACVERAAHRAPAAGRATEQDQMRDSIRVAGRVGDRRRHRAVEAQQRNLVQAGGVDDRVEVTKHRVERQIGDVALRMTGAARVVTARPGHRGPASRRRGETPRSGPLRRNR